MNRGILWCPHCGDPHPLGTKICPKSAKTLERGVNTTPSEKNAHPLLGTVLGGRYVVTKLIGSGAMGDVFEAENRALQRMVAVKVMRPASDRKAVATLEREARLVAAVHHPNICDVYDVGLMDDRTPYLVLERLSGETLADVLRREGRLSDALTADIFAQMLSGLQAAHGAQIVHRDVKPKNVFLVDRLGMTPLVKMLDFGLAKDLSGSRAASLTSLGAVVGTLRYMAPEQLQARPIDHRADLFAAGVMLYEALTGTHPFGAGSAADVTAGILYEPPAPLARTRPDLQPEVQELVMRALAKDPAQRWQSALAMQRVLGHALARPSQSVK